MRALLRLLLGVAGSIAGCEEEHFYSGDPAPPDVVVGLDAPGLDGGMDAPTGMDAPAPFDGGMDASWGPCSYGGAMGTCVATALCPATSMSVRGLCPGPADIQCCVPRTDAGPLPDGGGVTAADVLASLGTCARIGGDYGNDAGDPETIPVCQTADVIWWTADFDVDCDGGSSAICMSDPYYQPETSGVDSMGNPLDASTLPFIVIPLPSARFRYADHGISIGQVALVIYAGRMVYGIFGDAGPASGIGEGSYAMAEALGIPPDPSTGGVDAGVTYLVFTGPSANVTRNEDHDEAVRLGTMALDAFLSR